MSVLDILKPSPPAKTIEDQKIVKKKYKYWRIRTFYSMYIGYAFFYFSRKSFTFAMPALIRDLGFDKVQLGMLASILSITYGVSKFLSGIMSDKSNPRYFMAIGLILTGIFNIFFGFSSTILMFAIFWGLNGWFQGWGWPPCAKLLTHWYSKSERGTWWSLWNTSHNLGGAAIPILAAVIAQYMGWRYAMYVPGVMCIMAGLFLINRLRDTPQALGLPAIEKYRKEPEEEQAAERQTNLSAKQLLFEYVLKNKFIWILGIAYFFIYIIRTGINDWTTLFLVEAKGYSLLKASSTIFWFEIGGFLGSLVAGWTSDHVFKGKRGPVNVIFALLTTIFVFGMWKVPGGVLLIDTFFIFMIGFSIFGPQMLIGIAAAELSHKKAAGTSTGFVGTFAYIGAATAGAPLGLIMRSWGWEGFFVCLFACGLISIAFLTPLWGKQKFTRQLQLQEQEQE